MRRSRVQLNPKNQWKRENWQRRKREIEVKEKQEERFTGGRVQYKSIDEVHVVKIDEDGSAKLHFRKNYHPKKGRTFNYIYYTRENFEKWGFSPLYRLINS